jgi:C1A family cysteine protease
VLTQLRKQAWFVFLMTFVIGWSSAVLASAQPRHQQMMTELSVPQSHSAEMLAMSNCHEAQTSPVQLKHDSSSHVQIQVDQDCHPSIKDQMQHASCSDCAQLHCQSLSTWLDVQTVKLFRAEEIQQLQQLNFDYSAQHLNGFWQQILRPPKA